jgi:hypothetical protein
MRQEAYEVCAPSADALDYLSSESWLGLLVIRTDDEQALDS